LSSDAAIFRHYGVSPWEIEVIFATLRRTFVVQEEELRPDESDYVSMIEIHFPFPYGEAFFQQFSMESWFRIKGVLKDVKRRRGRKGLKTYVQFEGVAMSERPHVMFPLLSKSDRPYEMGIEKLEYLVDIVPLQLKGLPEDALEVWYSFDEASFKWFPGVASGKDGRKYVFASEAWRPSA
jgi:hypothetical protein